MKPPQTGRHGRRLIGMMITADACGSALLIQRGISEVRLVLGFMTVPGKAGEMQGR